MGELVATGDVIAGKFRVERILGRGGMGIVVAATHLMLERQYAIKLLAFGGGDQERAMARFLSEARAASMLISEHVCRVFDFGSLENGTPFMVMEYLEGSDLARTLSQRGPIAFDRFSNSEMKGYAYMRIESQNRLIGGWCFESDISQEGILDIPRLDSLAPLIWIREGLDTSFPVWVERYFSG